MHTRVNWFSNAFKSPPTFYSMELELCIDQDLKANTSEHLFKALHGCSTCVLGVQL